MKKLLLSAIAVLTVAGAIEVSAADLPARVATAAPVRAGCAQFGGWYGGVNGGWVYYKNDWTDRDNYGFNFTGQDHVGDGSLTKNGWSAGVQGGYNWQRGCTVFGVQADWDWASANAETQYRDSPAPGEGTLTASSKLRWLGTARARTGVVVDNLLIYATGGLAFANFNREFTYANFAGTTEVFSGSRTSLGFVVGLGTEWALGNNWSINSEVLYMGFERNNQTFNCSRAATCTGLAVGTPWRFDFADSMWTSRIGLNYTFGGR